MDWLIAQGIDRNRLTSKGYGETRPLVPNDSDEHRAANRRVEFTIVSRQ
jgi:outer membrane protein OmpA-like peptidoglycan-associated protein